MNQNASDPASSPSDFIYSELPRTQQAPQANSCTSSAQSSITMDNSNHSNNLDSHSAKAPNGILPANFYSYSNNMSFYPAPRPYGLPTMEPPLNPSSYARNLFEGPLSIDVNDYPNGSDHNCSSYPPPFFVPHTTCPRDMPGQRAAEIEQDDETYRKGLFERLTGRLKGAPRVLASMGQPRFGSAGPGQIPFTQGGQGRLSAHHYGLAASPNLVPGQHYGVPPQVPNRVTQQANFIPANANLKSPFVYHLDWEENFDYDDSDDGAPSSGGETFNEETFDEEKFDQDDQEEEEIIESPDYNIKEESISLSSPEFESCGHHYTPEWDETGSEVTPAFDGTGRRIRIRQNPSQQDTPYEDSNIVTPANYDVSGSADGDFSAVNGIQPEYEDEDADAEEFDYDEDYAQNPPIIKAEAFPDPSLNQTPHSRDSPEAKDEQENSPEPFSARSNISPGLQRSGLSTPTPTPSPGLKAQELVERICLKATQRYLRAHIANWRERTGTDQRNKTATHNGNGPLRSNTTSNRWGPYNRPARAHSSSPILDPDDENPHPLAPRDSFPKMEISELSLLNNASTICTLLWEHAQRQRAHVLGAEMRALEEMKSLMQAVETVAFSMDGAEEDIAAVAAGKTVCSVLGDDGCLEEICAVVWPGVV